MDAREARYKLQVARTLLGTGMVRPERLDKSLRAMGALRRWGPSSPAAYLGGAIRFPDRPAIVDDRGAVSFREVHRRTNALASELRRAGIRAEHDIAIMCRNHRGFVEATVACAKLGAGALYLNTAFAGPQIADVLRREDPAAVIYDQEFADLVGEGAEGRKRYVAWREPGEDEGEVTL
jgi:acyl-CoA synthetase (AMP-forming)/AMP-acid ligase II